MIAINIENVKKRLEKAENNSSWYQSRNFMVIASFVLLAILSCILLIHNGVVYGGSDTEFQWQRIMELRKSFQHLNFFPQISTYQYSNMGSAVMSLYPYVNLFPVVILSFLIKSNIMLIYVVFIIRTLSLLLISYYSSYHFYENWKTSYLFALIYGLSGMFLSYNFRSMDLGVVTVIIVLPMVIFGFLALLTDNKWLELSLGMSMTVFSHILSTVFIAAFLFLWLIINYKKIDKNKIITISKAVGFTLILTAVFWMNAFSFYTSNHINPPITFSLGGSDVIQIIKSGLSFSYTLNNSAFLPGIFTLISIIMIGVMFFKRLTSILKQVYVLGVLMMIVCSNFFPWESFQNTPISILQFPWRLFIIPQVLLSYVLAFSLTHYFNNKYSKRIFYGTISLALLMQFMYQHDIIQFYKNSGSQPILHVASPEHPIAYNNGNPVYSLATSDQFNNITKERFFTSDYLPKESLPMEDLLRNSQALYDVDKKLQIKYVGNNEYVFNNTDGTISELNLPFVTYNNVNYHVYLDGNLVSSHSNGTQLLTINNVSDGKHKILIKYDSNLEWFDILISMVGIFIFIYILYLRYFKSLYRAIYLNQRNV